MRTLDYSILRGLPFSQFKERLEREKASYREKLDSEERFDDFLTGYYTEYIDALQESVPVSIDLAVIDPELTLSDIELLIENSRLMGLPLKLVIEGGSLFRQDGSVVRMLFNDELLELLGTVDRRLRDMGLSPLIFEEAEASDGYWTYDEVLRANTAISALVSEIKAHGYTPFEACAYIHRYARTAFFYNVNEDMPVTSRSIVGIYNSDQIVCAGFSYLFVAVIERLAMDGLYASDFSSHRIKREDFNESDFDYTFTLGGDHSQVLVGIEDPKYGISGYYVEDVCFDVKTEKHKEGLGFANFLFPVSDLDKYITEAVLPDTVELFMMGIGEEEKTFTNNVVRDHGGKYPPITYLQLRECLYNLYKSFYPNEDDGKVGRFTDRVMRISAEFALLFFKRDAEGALIRYAVDHPEIFE